MLSAVKPKYRVRQDLEKSENEKMGLCGQSPLVDTENTIKVKKTAAFLRNQPFLLAKYDIFAPFQFGFTEFHTQSETLREKVKLFFGNETILIGLINWNCRTTICKSFLR